MSIEIQTFRSDFETVAYSSIRSLFLLRPKKNIELFLGHCRICLKSPILLFLLLSKKEKEKKTLFKLLNIIIGNDHVVSLGRCGPLPIMLASLFILDSISGISSIFSTVFLSVIEPQQCKFYA